MLHEKVDILNSPHVDRRDVEQVGLPGQFVAQGLFPDTGQFGGLGRRAF